MSLEPCVSFNIVALQKSLKTKNKIKTLLREQPLFPLSCKEALTVTNNELESLPNGLKTILKEFDDLFLKEFPSGLPPLRGIEHKINLVPKASPPNRPAYRTNPKETKEIGKQVDELVKKR